MSEESTRYGVCRFTLKFATCDKVSPRIHNILTYADGTRKQKVYFVREKGIFNTGTAVALV